MQIGNELKNDVIDTLTIIVAADSINPVIEERGEQQKRIDRFVFNSETSDEITIKFVDSKGISIYGVEYEILSEDVPKAIGLSEEDGIATVTRKKDGGTTVIRASVNSGLAIETYDFTIYTNYNIPESLINALRSGGVIADISSDMYGIYVKSIFDKVTSIDLSKLSLGYAVEVYNDSEDINYLEYFPNLTSLNLSNTRLTSPTVSLDGNERLKELRIENDKNTSFHLQDVTDIPTGLQYVDVSGNAISEYGLFSKAGNSLKTLDLSNTAINQFNDRNYTALTNLDISNCSKMKKLVISQEFSSSSSIVDASNSALTKAEISSRQLKSLHLENNDLTEVVIDGCDNRNGLREIYLQNNNLGTGSIQIGSFSYDNHSWSTRDWKVYSCLTTLVAYGNNIYGTHGQSTVTWRVGCGIPANTVMADLYAYADHNGLGSTSRGTWLEIKFGDYRSTANPTLNGFNDHNYLRHSPTYSEIGNYAGKLASSYVDGSHNGHLFSSSGESATIYPFGK